jgi:hypothetical protein
MTVRMAKYTPFARKKGNDAIKAITAPRIPPSRSVSQTFTPAFTDKRAEV